MISSPVASDARGCFFLSHVSDFRLRQADSMDQLIHQVSRQRLLWRLRRPPRWLDPVVHTSPKVGLRHVKLVPENLFPHACAVGIAVHWMRYLRTQDSSIWQGKLELYV